MRVYRVKSLFRFLKNVGITIVDFKVRAVLGRVWQNGNNPVEFGITYANVILGAAALGYTGTADAFVINRTDRLPVDPYDTGFRLELSNFPFHDSLEKKIK